MPITQIITPTMLKKETKRATRMIVFLPVNAYVRNIRMTEDMEDMSARKGGEPSRAYIVKTAPIIKV